MDAKICKKHNMNSALLGVVLFATVLQYSFVSLVHANREDGEEHFQALTDSVHEASGFQAVPDTLSVRTARMYDWEAENRIVKKLGLGALMGTVPTYGLGAILMFASGNTEGFGAGLVLDFTVAFGYPVGAAIGVSLVDPHDRFILSLAGSAAGFMVGALIPRTQIYQFSPFRWDVVWNWFAGPLVGATIMSEWCRNPLESPRFSVGLKPDTRGNLSAVASWRF